MKENPISPSIRSGKNVMLIALLALLAACVSPQKLLETGNYDAAIYKSVNKLVGKKKKKEQYVYTLETAFMKATQTDVAAIEQLKKSQQADKWVHIHRIAQRIDKRQRRVEPLLPIVARNGIKAEFNFVKVNALEQEAKTHAAHYHYETALQLLEQAKRGDKAAARAAHQALRNIDAYFEQYKDKTDLLAVAKRLGTTNILIRMENDSRSILPQDFERELLQLNTVGMNSFWKNYYTNYTSKVNFDYEAVLKIQHLEVSPGRLTEREFEESKAIQDGFEYVLDENGNVAKDTLGNDIKQPRQIIVSALVLESYQTKLASVTARLELRALETSNLISSKRLQADAVFEHYASTFQGDKRALSPTTCERIGNRPQPFPSDVSLIFEAGEQLKPIFKEKVRRMEVR
ncbi:MAG: hypothetical protein AAF847_09690 [Bacteroidota bacterium]